MSDQLAPTGAPHSSHNTKTYSFSTEELKVWFDAATTVRDKAYCPYSHFYVGALILPKPNTPAALSPSHSSISHPSVPKHYPGANFENASFPAGTCAERVALGTAIVNGLRPGDIEAVFIVAKTAQACSPCGVCRQALREFCDKSVRFHLFGAGWLEDMESGKEKPVLVVKTMEELLPMSFGPGDLKDGQVN